MTLPTFFIIGAAKAGTTSLHYYLDQHPQVQMSANKEPRFFAGPENGVPFAPGRISSLAEYERLFDPAIDVRGEASTDYATHPRRVGVPARIKSLVPDAKILYLVRDPIARTISHYQMRVALLGERRSLREALSDLSDPSSPYVYPSLYATQLELYLRHFEQENMMVIDQSDLLSDRRATLQAIFSFLSVDHAIDSSLFEKELQSRREWRTYSPSYVRVVEGIVVPALRWVPARLRRSVRHSVERLLWPPLQTPALDDESRVRLHELYAGEVERLRRLTGHTFPSWSI
jgi:hypothetical protein